MKLGRWEIPTPDLTAWRLRLCLNPVLWTESCLSWCLRVLTQKLSGHQERPAGQTLCVLSSTLPLPSSLQKSDPGAFQKKSHFQEYNGNTSAWGCSGERLLLKAEALACKPH